MRTASVCAAAATIAVLGVPSACAQNNAQTGARNVPPKDSFKGQLRSGPPSLGAAHGRVGVDVAKTGASGSTENITLTFRGLGCSHKHNCVQPNGTLTGTMKPVGQRVPDVGSSFDVQAAGKLRPLGHVSATGTVHGTGFIARGYLTMVLKLTSKSGALTVDAQAGPVKGFTSP